MAAEGMRARPRGRHRHHRRPAGARSDLQGADRPRRRRHRRGPDLPGRGPGLLLLRGRHPPGRDRRRGDADRPRSRSCSTSSTREGRRPKFIYSVPTFQNPGGVTLSLERRRRLVEIAREREILLVEDNPYGLLRYEGDALPTLYSLDGGDYVLYMGTFSKILSPGIRIGWVCAPPPVMEKLVLGKQAADLCTSTLSQYFVGEYFGEGRWLDYVGDVRDDLPLAPRRDAARRSSATSRAQATLVAARGRAVRLGDAARLHRHDRPAGQGAARERRLRARAGGVRRRPRLGSMRLNFSAQTRGGDPRGHPPDRRRRSASRSASTRRSPASTGRRPRARRRRREARTDGARSLPLRPPATASTAPAMKVAVIKGGRSLERVVSLRSGRAGRGCARRARSRGRPDRRRRGAGRRAQGAASRRRLHRPARARRRGRHRAGAARDPRDPLHGPGRRRLRALHGQGPVQAPDARAPGSRRPDWVAFNAAAFRELGAADALDEIEAGLGFPLVVKPAAQGSALGVRFAGRPREVPAALVAALQLRRPGAARAPRRPAASWRSRSSTARRCRRRGDPRAGRPLQLRGPLRDRPHRYACPAELEPATAEAVAEVAAAHLGGARLRGLRPGRRDARRRSGPQVLEVNSVPGLTDTSLLPMAAEAAGTRFEEFVARALELALRAEALGAAGRRDRRGFERDSAEKVTMKVPRG